MDVDASGDEQDRGLQQLFLELIRSLVKDGEGVSMSLIPNVGFSTLQVRASSESIAVLVGAKGQMARALRTILAGSGAKLGRRYALDLCPCHSEIDDHRLSDG